MRHITLICVGTMKEEYYSLASAEYEKRITRFAQLRVEEIEKGKSPAGSLLKAETAAIERKIPIGAYRIALTPEGRQLSSEELSKLICDESSGKFCFVVGGPEGLSEKIKSESDLNLSMSRMTFPHRLARIMILEQIYRALSILSNGKYHK